MNIRKILVGIDFSVESKVALDQALEIARHTGASVTLLHCGAIPDHPAVPPSMETTVDAYIKILDQRLAEDREQLRMLRERHAGQGVDISHMVIDGFADKKIPQAAKELGADLVVVGTHGRTGVKRFLLGSVAERVTRLCESNVMVARPREDGRGGFQRILVPTDFSKTSERALAVATNLATAGARITVLHCWQIPPMATASYAPVKAAQDLYVPMREELGREAAKSGAAFIDTAMREGVDFDFRHVESTPAEGIQSWLDENECGLVVMGSHGRRGLRRFLLGSVAEVTIRHAPCSVLVVHPEPEKEA